MKKIWRTLEEAFLGTVLRVIEAEWDRWGDLCFKNFHWRTAFSWMIDNVLFVFIAGLIIGFVMPVAVVTEIYIRCTLHNGKLYKVGARHIPFFGLPNSHKVYPNKQELKTAPTKSFYKGAIDIDNDVILLLTHSETKDIVLNGWGAKLDGTKVKARIYHFLHPEGRMIELTWEDDKELLVSLKRAG